MVFQVYPYDSWPIFIAIGMGYVPCEGESADEVLASTYEIEIAGVRVKAEASLAPIYDPKAERMQALSQQILLATTRHCKILWPFLSHQPTKLGPSLSSKANNHKQRQSHWQRA